jgi:lysophospholipase L1-like esterase
LNLAPPTPKHALRLVAAVLTVVVVVLLGSSRPAGQPRPTYEHYVAMGDSYTAAPYVPLTDVARGCFRSGNNYPHLVANALRIDDLQDRSCSGAQTKDLPGRQLTALRLRVPPQFDALSKTTDLVTVGIGANDNHLYARIATVCRHSRDGCRLYDERARLGSYVDELRATLTATLADIKTRAPKARVLLIGYPKLFPARGDCSRIPRMRPQDRSTFRNINRRLRDQMRRAARDSGVEFVDFYHLSYGHNICARHPWVQGRIGNIRRGAALHPLPAGQAALAQTIVRILRREPPGSSTKN